MTRKAEPEARTRALRRLVEKLLMRVEVRIDEMVGWVKLRSSAGQQGKVPTIVSDDDDAERLTVAEQYGVASSPPAGAKGLAIAVGAEQEQRVIVGVVSPSGRPATDSNEVVLWSSAGQRIHLMANGDILLEPAAGRKVYVGGTGGEAPAKATVTRSELTKLVAAIKSVTIVAGDGGASIKTAVTAAFPLPDPVADLAAERVEVR